MSAPDPVPWDELHHAMAVVQRGLEAGQIGNEGLATATQVSHKGVCEEFNEWIWTYLHQTHPVRLKWNELMYKQPTPGPLRLLNTTNPNQL